MDEIKILVWIVIGLVYFLSRRKKQEPPPRRVPRPETHESTDEPLTRPKTFEELLREIQGMKEEPQPKVEPYRPVSREPQVVDYDENVAEEAPRKKTVSYYEDKEDKIYQTYEDAKKLAFYRPSLEETVKLEDTIVRFKHFEGYQKEERRNLAKEYRKVFQDPESFRRAFIMSEILKRKF